MNELRNRIKEAIRSFSLVVTLECIVATLFITFFWGADNEVEVNLIWQILLTSAICTVGKQTLFYGGISELSKRQLIIRTIICFLYVNGVILVSGFFFEWFYLSDWYMVLGMELAIIGVFIAITLLNYTVESKTAEHLNHRLKEREEDKRALHG